MQTPPPPPPSGPTAVEYAGFWRRLAAFLIDGVILSVVTVPLSLAFTGGVDPADPNAQAAYLTSPAYGLSTVIQWLYSALMESSSRQATLGKMALGIRVTDVDGSRIGFGRATGRYFAKILSGLILFIGFLMIAFTQKKQGLHDMIAGTLVVR